jgi:hypothetical protein
LLWKFFGPGEQFNYFRTVDFFFASLFDTLSE